MAGIELARISKKEHREISLAAILSAAEYLFVTRGYNATTTGEIGKLAGLTKGAVYFYFADKEAVLLELLNSVRQIVLIPITQRLRNNELSPTQRISGFLEYGGWLSKESPGSMLLPIVVSIEFAGSGSVAEKRVKAGYRKVMDEVRNVLEIGQDSGEFRNDLSAEEMARALIATNDGLMLECLRNDLKLEAEKLVSTLNAIVLVGIGKGSSPNKVARIQFEDLDSRSILEVLRSRLPAERKAPKASKD
jgi:AcrR family transcriptional regulator